MAYQSLHLRLREEHLDQVALLAHHDSQMAGRQVSQADIVRQAMIRYLRERTDDVVRAKAARAEQGEALAASVREAATPDVKRAAAN